MTNWKQHPLANLALWFFILGDGGGGGGLPCILMFWYNVREREREVHAQADLSILFLEWFLDQMSFILNIEQIYCLSWFRILLVNSSKKCGWIFPYLAYDVPVYNTCCILAVVNKIRIIYSWWIKNYKFKYISIVGQHEDVKF